jgi:diaminohydroxyphosphoribosylaminopyrimidine deaminase/5-amino-6-(5-phosphoribosylamino)uracil reductase
VRQPLRVVLDGGGRTPPGARVRRGDVPALVLTADDVGPGPAGRGVDLDGALAVLHARQVRSVLLEGGPTLAGAFLDAGLVDRVVAYIAPALLGQGTNALSAALTGASMDAIRRLELQDVARVGPDVRIVATLVSERPVGPPMGDGG